MRWRRVGGIHAGECAVEIEHAPAGHIGGEAVVFGKVADGRRAAGSRLLRPKTMARSGGGMRAGEQHFDESGFARAVGAEEAVGGSFGDAERDIVDGAQFALRPGGAEDFGESFGLDGVFGHYSEDSVKKRGGSPVRKGPSCLRTWISGLPTACLNEATPNCRTPTWRRVIQWRSGLPPGASRLLVIWSPSRRSV